MAELTACCLDTRRSNVRTLVFLAEVETRQLYLRAAASSMWDYARRMLRMSHGAAHRNVCVARLCRKYPFLLDSGIYFRRRQRIRREPSRPRSAPGGRPGSLRRREEDGDLTCLIAALPLSEVVREALPSSDGVATSAVAGVRRKVIFL